MRIAKIGAIAAVTIGTHAGWQSQASAASASQSRHVEVGFAVLSHGVRKPFRAAPPIPGTIYESEEERGTADVEVVVRSAPIGTALRPRLTAKVQLNTDGRTSFGSVGAEWRQHILAGRLYGQVGIGLAVHDGYLRAQDPFEAGLGRDEALRRLEIYNSRTAFGSRILFNPNLSIGIRISDRVALEAVIEHYSHAGFFSSQNPGIDSVGIRLVHTFDR